MSEKYDEYIKEHKENVTKGLYWMIENIPEIFVDDQHKTECINIIRSHDASKFSEEEYQAYDVYFYGRK